MSVTGVGPLTNVGSSWPAACASDMAMAATLANARRERRDVAAIPQYASRGRWSPLESLRRPQAVEDRHERRAEEQRPHEAVRLEEREVPRECHQCDDDGVRHARPLAIRDRHRVGDHEEGEQEEPAVAELM